LQAQAFKKFIPMFDRVLVERFAAEIKTKSGIMIPEKAQGKIQQATIRAVGSGGRTEVALPLTLYISY
jgi:chaperonin GroES